ncbi:MAG: DUF1631 domain-containing protein [Gammaproteobacteria bacterium]|nr:DUF1631 domain-containing protein [Gammaproteobacteria bacterium]
MSEQRHQSENINYNELVSELKNTLNFHLKELFTSFFNNADTALFELANEASNSDEQKQYFDLLHSIRTDKANLSRGLSDALRTYLKPVNALSPATSAGGHDSDDDELTLVSQDSMDEIVLVNTIASKTYDKFSESIGKLALRLDFLAEHTPMIFRNDALIPQHFCESFKQCITILELSTAEKLILYKLFDNEVANKLNILYDTLNNLLIDAGILPKVQLHARRTTAHGDTLQAASSDIQSNIDSDESTEPGYADSGKPFSSILANDHYAAALINKYGNRNIGGYPIGHASKIIRDFIGSSSASAGSIDGDPQFYGHKDVLTALTQMQGITQSQIQSSAPPVIERIDAAAIKQALLSTIASQQGGTITKQINQVIEKTIDFIKLIFDAIIDDASISDTIKALLLSLQIPVIKASMLDQEFFVNDDHPARELLDKIAELSVGVTEHTDPLYIELHVIIKSLLADYVNDVNAFVTALDNVKDIISRQQTAVEAKEQEAKDEIQKEHARKIVLWELRKSTLEKKLPSLVHKLVLKLWPTLMFNHYIKHGKQNDNWVSLVTTLGEIVDSVQKPSNASEYKSLKDNHEDLTLRVEKILQRSKRAKEHIPEVLQDLRQTHAQLLDTEEFDAALQSPELSTMPVMDTPISPNTDASSAGEHGLDGAFTQSQLKEPAAHPDEPVDLRAKLQLLPGEVRPGVWFQITLDNQHTRRLKLSVIIMEEALLVFVDHNGERIVEKDAETFAEDLKNGNAQIIMHHSVFDHALGSVFNNIQ